MAQVTRLGLTATPARLYGAFSGKTASALVLAMRRVTGDLWVVSWSSPPTGPYRIFRDGVQVDETNLLSWRFHAGANEAPLVEVLDDPLATPTPARSARLTLTWQQVAATTSYRVEQFIASAWTEVATVKETGAPDYTHQTDTLDDDTTHSFRVVPVGTNGNDGTPAVFRNLKMIRHPDPPNVAMAFNDGAGTVTITEA